MDKYTASQIHHLERIAEQATNAQYSTICGVNLADIPMSLVPGIICWLMESGDIPKMVEGKAKGGATMESQLLLDTIEKYHTERDRAEKAEAKLHNLLTATKCLLAVAPMHKTRCRMTTMGSDWCDCELGAVRVIVSKEITNAD